MRKIQRHTQAKMYGHVDAFKDSNQSQKAYCREQGIAYSTFQYWAKKFRKESISNNGTNSSQGFIPIKVHQGPEVLIQGPVNQLHFLYPNGIQVMCSERINPEVLKTLINP